MKIVYWTCLVSAVVLKRVVWFVGFVFGFTAQFILNTLVEIDGLIHHGFDMVIEACESELGIKKAEIDPEWEIPVSEDYSDAQEAFEECKKTLES